MPHCDDNFVVPAALAEYQSIRAASIRATAGAVIAKKHGEALDSAHALLSIHHGTGHSE
jgi:hypothetical protein